MKGFLRRLRGIIGTGLTWAIGWAGVTVALDLLWGFPVGGVLVPLAINSLISAGFASGSVALARQGKPS